MGMGDDPIPQPVDQEHGTDELAEDRPVVEAIASGSPEGMTDVARSVTASQMLIERRIVFERLNRMGVICVDVPPDQVSPRLVSTYLSIKAREMI